jgi:hypothetical protein
LGLPIINRVPSSPKYGAPRRTNASAAPESSSPSHLRSSGFASGDPRPISSAFDRRLDGPVLDFGVSSLLRHSDLIMWDRQTESLWQQLDGSAIAGAYTGARLELVPSLLLSWADFRAAYPQDDVLSRETGAR